MYHCGYQIETMKKILLLSIFLFLSFTSQAQIADVWFHVGKAYKAVGAMKSTLEGMTRGSKSSRNGYASRLRTKASNAVKILNLAEKKIPGYNYPNWKHPKFKKRGFTQSKTNSFINRMRNNMYTIRINCKDYIDVNTNSESRKHMNKIISSYNDFFDAYKAFNKYVYDVKGVEAAIALDKSMERQRNSNRNMEKWRNAQDKTKELINKKSSSRTSTNGKKNNEVVIKTGKNTTITKLKASAQAGNSEAQVKLSKYYEKKGDRKSAFYWTNKAAIKGNVEGQKGAGTANLFGIGTTKNERQAFYWFNRAAQKGDSYSQAVLGQLYYEGIGVTANKQKAFYWFKKGAGQGNSDAEFGVANLYYSGEGTAKNYAQALVYAKRAANSKNARAQAFLAALYKEERNYELAFSWYKKAANQNHIDAMNWLATFYENGIGTAKNTQQALYWYRKLASKGVKSAQKKVNSLSKNISIPGLTKLGIVKRLNTLYQKTGVMRSLWLNTTTVKFYDKKLNHKYGIDVKDIDFNKSKVKFDKQTNSPWVEISSKNGVKKFTWNSGKFSYLGLKWNNQSEAEEFLTLLQQLALGKYKKNVKTIGNQSGKLGTKSMTKNDIWKRMNVLKKRESSFNSVKFQNGLVTMYSKNSWWSVDLDDIDFSKSTVELDKKDNLYRLWIRTKNEQRKIIPSWGSDSHRLFSVGTPFKSRSDALEFKSLLQQLASGKYKKNVKTIGNRSGKLVTKSMTKDQIWKRMSALYKKTGPRNTAMFRDGNITLTTAKGTIWNFDIQYLDLDRCEATYSTKDNKARLWVRTYNGLKEIYHSDSTKGFTGVGLLWNTKKDAQEFLDLLKQLRKLK